MVGAVDAGELPRGGTCYGDDDLLPLSGIQHFSYCERQWALIHLECRWEENLDTTLGEQFHERAHLAGYSSDKGVIAERSMRIFSRRLGFAGESDVVEFFPCNEETGVLRGDGYYGLRPVEYKKGRFKSADHDRLQLVAQALCLEEMYEVPVTSGSLFYGETRRRERVEVTGELRERVEEMARRMHELLRAGETPRAKKSARCARCSLKNECAPEIFTSNASGYWRDLGIDWTCVDRGTM